MSTEVTTGVPELRGRGKAKGSPEVGKMEKVWEKEP